MLDLRRVDYLCYAWAIGKPWLGRLLSSRCHCRSLSLWSVGWCAENASPDGRAWKYAHFISRVYINQQNVHFEYFRWKPHISTLKFKVSVIFWHHFFFSKIRPRPYEKKYFSLTQLDDRKSRWNSKDVAALHELRKERNELRISEGDTSNSWVDDVV